MLKMIWTANIVARPAARHLPSTVGAFRAMLYAETTKKPKAAITATIPSSPNSSPTSAKIMSVCSSGTGMAPPPAPVPR